MSHTKLHGFILAKKQTSLSGNTHIVVYTKERGKLAMRAKGLGKIKSSSSSLLTPGREVVVDVVGVGQAFPLITHVHAVGGVAGELPSYAHMEALWMFLEVVEGCMLHEGEKPEVYTLLSEWASQFATVSHPSWFALSGMLHFGRILGFYAPESLKTPGRYLRADRLTRSEHMSDHALPVDTQLCKLLYVGMTYELRDIPKIHVQEEDVAKGLAVVQQSFTSLLGRTLRSFAFS